jgi:hypothetical protein
MDSKKFYDILEGLGEFRCTRDLRRFNYKAKKNPKWNVNQYLSHFGHCKNGSYHHCEYELKRDINRVVIYYWKTIEQDGEKIRVRGNQPMKNFGRGRPPAKKS